MKAIVLAGGKGSRIFTADDPMPKVLRRANGLPMLQYVLNALDFIPDEDITLLVGYMHEAVESEFASHPFNFVRQGDDAYGTGYAVMCAMASEQLKDYHGDILVVNGDAPLTNRSTVYAMKKLHEAAHNACTLFSCVSSVYLPYGRVIRENGQVKQIIEEKDCTPEQKLIRELNIGMYIFDADMLREALKNITPNNAQNEYYLTDVPLLMLAAGKKADAFITSDETEILGVNTFDDLANVEKILREREQNRA